MTKDNATPRPWNYHTHKVIYNGDTQGAFLSNRDYAIAVRAVNSFEKLVKACNGIIWVMNNIHNYGTEQFKEFLISAHEDIKKALIEAEGKK